MHKSKPKSIKNYKALRNIDDSTLRSFMILVSLEKMGEIVTLKIVRSNGGLFYSINQ
jgi:hypothetical protein